MAVVFGAIVVVAAKGALLHRKSAMMFAIPKSTHHLFYR
jgi:hypothetical protein